VVKLARQRFPDCKLILCTWCFDVLEKSDGEYEGLAALLKADPGWCDMIMTDAHGSFPDYPLKHGVPGGLPMINFAEISMWGRYPWGGSGANPFPKRMVTIWNQAKHLLDGGLPYSEGRFEDINKVTCLSLFWNKQAVAADIVRDYVNFEYGANALPALTQAIDMMEDIYPSANLTTEATGQVYQRIQQGEKRLAPGAETRWRWRLLRARAIIDYETTRSPGIITVAQNDAYEELTQLYCAQAAGDPVAPRAKSYYQRADVTRKGPVYASHIGEHASNPESIKGDPPREGKRVL
jgi:hypothetical protein